MSALSAIEAPVPTGPDESDAARRSSGRGGRPLALVPSAPGPHGASDAAASGASREPRACSMPIGSGSPSDGRRPVPHRAVPEPRRAREQQRAVIQGRLIQPGTGREGGDRTQSVPGSAAGAPADPTGRAAPRTRTVRGGTAARADQKPIVATARPAADLGRTPVRLTRRGRVVVGVLAVIALTAAVLVITLVASGGAQATNHGQARAGYQGMREIVVQPGQTLWSIASATEPSVDPRVVVQEIMSANAMTTATISAGQLLWVPR